MEIILKKILQYVLLLVIFFPTAVCTKSSIAMVTISTPNRAIFAQYTLQSFRSYAERWGYDFYCLQDSLDASRPVPWSKILAVKNLLSKYDWVVWIDDDVFITNPTKSLKFFIEKCPDSTELIFTTHREFAQRFDDVNSGVFCVKNTPFGQEFLNKVWAIGNDRYNEEGGSLLDQSAIIELLRDPLYLNSPLIAKMPARTMQSILTLLYKGDQDDYGQWQPGDFCAHMAGGSSYCRELVFQQMAIDSNKYPVLPNHLSAYTIKQW